MVGMNLHPNPQVSARAELEDACTDLGTLQWDSLATGVPCPVSPLVSHCRGVVIGVARRVSPSPPSLGHPPTLPPFSNPIPLIPYTFHWRYLHPAPISTSSLPQHQS